MVKLWVHGGAPKVLSKHDPDKIMARIALAEEQLSFGHGYGRPKPKTKKQEDPRSTADGELPPAEEHKIEAP